ncbi:hypothetical protein CRG98_002807 [Punica granatum]|uniref:Uncharacterized protein n=1 Tax=Punica granatum TaxID=22663 RepID=A0A2I0L804_PUNGR|nr:hypothetical protein CRG98_002807 [Punica granatum]
MEPKVEIRMRVRNHAVEVDWMSRKQRATARNRDRPRYEDRFLRGRSSIILSTGTLQRDMGAQVAYH